MSDPILNELITYLRWPVQRTTEGYLIRFNYTDLIGGRLNGVGFNSTQGPRIEGVRAFDAVPLQFEMVQTSPHDSTVAAEVHYYSLGGQLHRERRPAKYTISPGRNGLTIAQYHYRHGVLHREDGPAITTMTDMVESPLQNEHGIDLHGPFQMAVETIHLAWYRDGASGVYPGPSTATLEDVVLLFDEDGGYSDHNSQPAIQAKSTYWWRSTRYVNPNELIPYMVAIEDFSESYQNNVWQSRSGTFDHSSWYRGPAAVGAIEDFPPAYFMDRVGLWSGPFVDAEMKVKLEHEFSQRQP